ncbi:MAG: baseplate J/gp47 family protein [Spirochaetota bacterium]|jgi:uncharacterized phage protein gp47/JayE
MKLSYSYNEIKSKMLTELNNDLELKKLFSINLNIVGKLRAIIEAIARAFYDFLNDTLITIYNNIFVSTADEQALILHLADRGMTPWKQATKANGVICIGCSKQPTSDITIPQLSMVKSNDDKFFIIQQAGIITPFTPQDARGYYTIRLPIISLNAGSIYNVVADTINELANDIPGIDIVYNDEPTYGGRDKETIDEVRERIKKHDVALQQGTKAWFEAKTLEFEFVSKVLVIPRYEGPGTVGIAFLTQNGLPTAYEKQIIQDYFNNDDIDPAGAWHVVIFDISIYIWDASIRIYFSENEPDDAELLEALTSYFSTLSLGEDIIEDQIKSTLIVNTGVKKVDIINHSGYVVDKYSFPVLGTISFEKVQYAEI